METAPQTEQGDRPAQMEDGQSEHTDKQPESHGYLDQLKSLDPHAETMYSGYVGERACVNGRT